MVLIYIYIYIFNEDKTVVVIRAHRYMYVTYRETDHNGLYIYRPHAVNANVSFTDGNSQLDVILPHTSYKLSVL